MDKDATGMYSSILCILLLTFASVFLQCSLVLPQPVSKDAVELFDEIVVLSKILNFVSTLLPIFIVFLYIICAKTVLDF